MLKDGPLTYLICVLFVACVWVSIYYLSFDSLFGALKVAVGLGFLIAIGYAGMSLIVLAIFGLTLGRCWFYTRKLQKAGYAVAMDLSLVKIFTALSFVGLFTGWLAWVVTEAQIDRGFSYNEGNFVMVLLWVLTAAPLGKAIDLWVTSFRPLV